MMHIIIQLIVCVLFAVASRYSGTWVTYMLQICSILMAVSLGVQTQKKAVEP